MFPRILEEKIIKKIGKGKAIVLLGPRQVGKTTLFQTILADRKHLFLDADDPLVRQILDAPNTEELKTIIGDHDLVFIDEAQRIPGIGLTLKLMTDRFKKVQVLVSGSSSFDLGQSINEPLTGRKWQYELFPISWSEFEQKVGFVKASQQLSDRLLYGFYPDILNNPGQEKELLKQLVNSYLFKDILAYGDIKKPEVLEKLLQALALHLGNEVSYSELAQTVGVDKNTVQRYIQILEKGYVIFRLGAYSSNQRNEIKRNKKIYFYDNGVRNMIISNFAPIDMREDKGALWENFLITERLKRNAYADSLARMYFWRTNHGQEIDLIEEQDGELTAFEFKWKAKPNARIPASFLNSYKAKAMIIDMDNFREIIG